ncbi:DUF1345 domain-containing protein [Cellulomonas sp. SG140]|uniref:DUF1345 domain-containing protein n=1 Tax=Cellulomonas sp. SG140 TaxID=2976536 RepID=UPI0021E6E16B|nr:DUF1345 domain-containing protein [Cellulomonas sp. SG140]
MADHHSTDPAESHRLRRLSGWLDVRPGIRIAVSAAAGVAVGLVLTWDSAVAAAMGAWATAGLLSTLWTWLVIVPMNATETAVHATREEPERFAAHLIVITAALASLSGVVLVWTGAEKKAGALGMATVLAAIFASWAAIHTMFALRYARMYYTGPDGGVDFHQQEPPQYTDFTYMAVTVGMSFAISDTDLKASSFRRTAQVHALLSYLFGTVILALLVNLVAGLSK